jgi:predicted nuclease of predicted toxin-antitoxin system
MRFIVDESTGQGVANFLKALGHDVAVVAEEMLQAEDQDILARAVADARIVVTNDKDFGDLVFRNGLPHAGILLLRLVNESAANRIAVVKSVLEGHAADLPFRRCHGHPRSHTQIA